MNHPLFIEPKRINRQKTMKAPVSVPLLVIDQPQLFVGAFNYAVVTRAQHVSVAVDNGIAGILHERAER